MVELDESYLPGFDFTEYEYPCLNANCDGTLRFHFSHVHYGTHGGYLDNAHSLDIISKCYDCGKLSHHQPPITEAQFDWFKDRWGDERFMAWSEETGEGRDEMEDVYGEDSGMVRERLDALGYI